MTTRTHEPIKVFISYSHDSPRHEDDVLELSQRLRADGVDCWIDQYELSPERGWHQWMIDRIGQSDFVLIICSEAYKQRFDGKASGGEGKGATWEGAVIKADLYDAYCKHTRFLPVVCKQEDVDRIPIILHSATFYDLSVDSGYDKLYRHLTGQPRIVPHPIGEVKERPPENTVRDSMPYVGRKQTFATNRRRIWNVPHRRNPFFTGRDDIIASLHNTFNSAISMPLAISGLGGAGKTQTAIEYAYRYRDEYDAVFWVRGETDSDLCADFLHMARLLSLRVPEEGNERIAVAAVKEWCADNSNWLLIVDNVEDMGMLQDYIPFSGGHILLTTRAHATGMTAERVGIERMSTEDGVLFLLRRADIIAPDAPIDTATPEDRAKARAICEEVEALPLALDQAGAFMEKTRISAAEYLELYRQEGDRLRAERGSHDEHPSVSITFSIAYARIENATTRDLLAACAFLPSDGVPEEVFTNGASELGPNIARVANCRIDLIETIAEAGRYSLVRRNVNQQQATITMHRVVQHAIKDEMAEDIRELWAKRVVSALSQTFPRADLMHWSTCERLVPLVVTVARYLDHYSIGSEAIADMLNNAGYYMRKMARYADAVNLIQRSLEMRKSLRDTALVDIVKCKNNLASAYRYQGQLSVAQQLYQESLDDCRTRLGDEHLLTAATTKHLAGVFYACGRYAEASELYERVLEIYERANEPDLAEIALTLNNLALMHRERGDLAHAEPLYKRAIRMLLATLEPEHPDVAIVFNNLASLYREKGEFRKADKLLTKALSIYEHLFGSDHLRTSFTMNHLGLLRLAEKDYDVAHDWLSKALDIRIRFLGPNHAIVARSIHGLAQLNHQRGDLRKARSLYEQAREIRAKTLAPDHPDLIENVKDIETVQQEMTEPTNQKR